MTRGFSPLIPADSCPAGSAAVCAPELLRDPVLWQLLASCCVLFSFGLDDSAPFAASSARLRLGDLHLRGSSHPSGKDGASDSSDALLQTLWARSSSLSVSLQRSGRQEWSDGTLAPPCFPPSPSSRHPSSGCATVTVRSESPCLLSGCDLEVLSHRPERLLLQLDLLVCLRCGFCCRGSSSVSSWLAPAVARQPTRDCRIPSDRRTGCECCASPRPRTSPS